MKGLVYHGRGKRAWETVPDRRIEQPTDAIVRIDSATICGTDLHILKGDVPKVEEGTILGHEAVGTTSSPPRADTNALKVVLTGAPVLRERASETAAVGAA
jgi:alcohol dehydrogenase